MCAVSGISGGLHKPSAKCSTPAEIQQRCQKTNRIVIFAGTQPMTTSYENKLLEPGSRGWRASATQRSPARSKHQSRQKRKRSLVSGLKTVLPRRPENNPRSSRGSGQKKRPQKGGPKNEFQNRTKPQDLRWIPDFCAILAAVIWYCFLGAQNGIKVPGGG